MLVFLKIITLRKRLYYAVKWSCMEYRVNGQNLLPFGYEIYNKLKGMKEPIFLCVGSDKFVIDCLGPIVAEKLKNQYNIPAIVYGGLGYNVNRTNLMEVVNYISVMHSNSSIVLIDATVDKSVGTVKITGAAFAGLGKCIPNRRIGAVSILAVVERKIANFNLNSTRLKLVVDMAEFIAKGCFLAVNRIKRERNTETKQLYG